MFEIGGKVYQNAKQLMAKQISSYKSDWLYGNEMPVYEDVHGRKVLHMRERFPCFDYFDRMYEDRYFHWHFILWEEDIALVYTQDDEPDKYKVAEHFVYGRGSGVPEDVYKELQKSPLMAQK